VTRIRSLSAVILAANPVCSVYVGDVGIGRSERQPNWFFQETEGAHKVCILLSNSYTAFSCKQRLLFHHALC